MTFAAAVTACVVTLSVLGTLDPAAAEAWAAHIYAPLTRVLAARVAESPWSWTALLLAAAPLAVAIAGRLRGVWAWLRATLVVGLVLWTAAIAIWAVHYQRAAWQQRVALTDAATDDDLAALAAYLHRIVSEAATAADPAAEAEAVASIARAHETLAWRMGDVPVDVPGTVKQVAPGLLLGFGASGVISPWLLEAHVDGALPAPARVAVAAHELAHLAGHAREDEAEAVGTLAGLRADHPYARYCVALFAWAALDRQRPDITASASAATLPPQARADLEDARAVAARYAGTPGVQVSRWLYDRWLRMQGVDEGIASYSRGISLFARAWTAGLGTEPDGTVPPPP